MRISDKMRIDSVRNNLNLNTEKLTQIEAQLASGHRINNPSDDPTGTATALRFRSQSDRIGQYIRTVNASDGRLSAADSALSSLSDVLQRANELSVQAGNAGLNQQEIGSIGAEVNQLVGHAIQLGNTNFGGQFLFAGTKTTTVPFAISGGTPDAPAAVTYNGNANAITENVGQGMQTRVDVPGDQAVLPTINALIQFRNDLNSGSMNAALAQKDMAALGSALDGVLQVRGTVGARVNTLTSLNDQMQTDQNNAKQMQSQIEDIDLADTVVRVNAAQNVYQAALGAAAKAIQTSLVDFLH